ncbi:MAG: 2-hydroxyacyl-CoA dehydratase [Chloroflexi bacterium]|nr:2-hydroxyacyl-CoA dehydratase [Chloroflexota bacterium]
MTELARNTGKSDLRTEADVQRARKSYWMGVREAKRKGVPVVVAFGLLPREIWYAMDVPVVGAESLAIQVSARQLSARYCEIAEQRGFSRELCAVHLSLIGMAGDEDRDPYLDQVFVEPDIIIGSSFACMSESKSFLYWVERFGCPFYVVDIPPNPWPGGVPRHAVEYLAGEFRRLIAFLETYGFRYRESRLRGAVQNSRRTMELWQEIEGYRARVPAPISAIDALHCIGKPLVLSLGSDSCLQLFEGLRDEVAERVRSGHVALEDERLRLYMVGVPPLYRLDLLDYPARYGAVIVKSDVDILGGSLIEPRLLDPEHPIESLAMKQIVDMVNPCFDGRAESAVRTVRDYRVDGVIGLNKRGCRNLPASLRLIKDAVYREAKTPMTVFDLDGIDSREYDESQVMSNIDSFVETLLVAGKAR